MAPREKTAQRDPAPAEAAYARETDPEVGAGKANAKRTAVESFTLDITLSGLCLLVRRRKAKQLRVLLPQVHGHGDNVPRHVAVLGAHRRFRPDGPFTKKGRFHESELSDGELVFEPASDHILELKFSPKLGDPEVANLSEVTLQNPVAKRARVQMTIRHGEICGDCDHDPGGTWRFNGKKQRMATRISWRIERAKSVIGSDRHLGVAITFKPHTGANQEFTVDAVEDPPRSGRYRAAFYLYHTPPGELPSQEGHPEDGGEVDRNHHFRAFFDLFDPKLDVPLPEPAEDENEDEGEGDEVRLVATGSSIVGASAVSLADVLGLKELTGDEVAKLAAAHHSGHGRLVTCTLATADDQDPDDDGRIKPDGSSASPARGVTPDGSAEGAGA
jgi:hypothetical protein